MKKQYIFGVLAVAGLSLASCDDFLDDNRLPISVQPANEAFWSNTPSVQGEVNAFYNDYQAYGNGAGTSGTFYFSWLNDDQCGRRAFATWTNTTVPATSSSWNTPYEEIRRANMVIKGVTDNGLAEAEKPNFIAIARLHRARNYFTLVKRYGDVPLIKEPLSITDTEIMFGPRVNRNTVMDFVLEDLNFAVENIATTANKTTFSKDMAQAMKAEICLFEASYAKYHQKDDARAKKFYEEVVKAGEAIASKYPIGNDYTSLYRSYRVAGGGYNGLTTNSEVIFMKAYEQGVFMHSLGDYSSASDGVAGITKSAFDSYLLLDGTLPAAGQDRGTPIKEPVLDKEGNQEKDDKGNLKWAYSYSIQNLLDARDKRLSMTTYPMAMYPGMTYKAVNTASMYSRTGYGVSKYNNPTMSESEVNTANKQYNCAPLFWGARLYLAILEAKAELGTIAESDITTYFKPLWDRAGITPAGGVTLEYLKNMNAADNDTEKFGPAKVSSLIWEIRRCRRCELIMDDDIRYWDLVRWHELERLDTTKNPSIVLGVYAGDSYVSVTRVEGYVDASYGQTREFKDREYLWPIPSGQLSLYPEGSFKQNPGW